MSKKCIAVSGVAKRFGAAGSCCRQGSGQISASQARRKVCAADILMQKARVETVAGAHGINRHDRLCRAGEPFGAALCQGSLLAEFYDE